MNVHQFLTSFSYGDAIGNEAVEIRDFLRGRGIGSEIFTLHFHPRYAHQVRNYLDYDRCSSPANTVIFHFSIGSPVTKKFLRLRDRKVIIYHNITPYRFFLDYHRILAKDCFKGRVELRSLAGRVDLALGDSEYNRRELQEAGFARTGVLPLVMDFAKFDQPVLPVFREIFADGKANLLFVGRIIPNKKVEDVIKVFHIYQSHFHPESRLFIVGESRGFERYLSALQDLVARLGIRDVHFSGHVPLAEMVSYAKLSHLYLHLSEHEGFCAPLLECFHLGIPVVAYDAGAVGETMNGGGMLLREKEPLAVAALCHEILKRPRLREALLARQRQALEKYQHGRTGEILLAHLGAGPEGAAE
ncbi:MAG: glycosyltransferase family 4 protein [Candidatus Aminicenantes bacterium]|nr:glycosyltransferase family 4 protein [Candidatus Aminicenantes bacterium]